MAELSPDLRNLVPAYKGANRPSDADSARVYEALRARLGEAAFLGTESSPMATVTANKGILLGKAALMSVTGLALAGGLWLLANRSQQVASLEAKPVEGATVISTPVQLTRTPSSPSVPQSHGSQLDSLPTVGAWITSSDNTRPSAARHARDTLAQEVSLLARAQAAMSSGKPAVALDELNAHERKFGHGLLAEERTAARIQALCVLGRDAEANAQLALLSSKSLHGRHAGQACVSRKNVETTQRP
ncbi:MAG TPA: hypothetical protein VIV60_03975 [Polyangiaceae bacterium]